MRNLGLLLNTIGKYLDVVSVGNLHQAYPLTNGIKSERHECGHVALLGNSYNICNFLVEMLTYKQTIKLSFGRNKFSRRSLQNLETKAHLWKKSRGKTD